tara:strand:- start:3015 stop:3968 length:954 start_codon:yes stop_codon:yes gene_type:complete
MATSNSYNFSRNRDELIKDAFIEAGILDPNDSMPSAEGQFGAVQLNRMIKWWQADGKRLWAVRKAYLFLEKDKNTYSLGATGDHWTESFVSTQIKTEASASATSIDVDSSAGMTASDNVLIELDDGTLHTTTISSVTDSDTIAIASGVASVAAVDNYVYTYTTKAQRPLQINSAVLHDKSADIDTRMFKISREQYWNLANKTTDSKPTEYYFDPQLTNANISIFGEPDNVEDYIIALCDFPIDDMDSASNDFSFPQEWIEPLTYNLAYRLAVAYRAPQEKIAFLRSLANETKFVADSWDVEKAPIQMRPDTGWIHAS